MKSSLFRPPSRNSSGPNNQKTCFYQQKTHKNQIIFSKKSTSIANNQSPKPSFQITDTKYTMAIQSEQIKKKSEQSSDNEDDIVSVDLAEITNLERQVKQSIAQLRNSQMYKNPESFFYGVSSNMKNSSIQIDKNNSEITEIDNLYKRFSENETRLKLETKKNEEINRQINEQDIMIDNLTKLLKNSNNKSEQIRNYMKRINKKQTQGFVSKLNEVLALREIELKREEELNESIRVMKNQGKKLTIKMPDFHGNVDKLEENE